MKLTVTHYDKTATFEIPEHSTCQEFFVMCRNAAHAVGYADETIQNEFLPDDAYTAGELARMLNEPSRPTDDDLGEMFEVVFTPDFPFQPR